MTEDVLRLVKRTLRGLKERGAVLVPVSLENTEYALSAYYVLASAEASSNMARYDGVEYGACGGRVLLYVLKWDRAERKWADGDCRGEVRVDADCGVRA